MATLRGEPVDRPPVSFYELNGLDENPEDDDPFNIYSHPSWHSLIKFTREKTDRIVMRQVPFINTGKSALDEITTTKIIYNENGSEFTQTIIQSGSQSLSSLTRKDRDVNTTWVIEPLLKNLEDLKYYLSLPSPEPGSTPDTTSIHETEKQLGDSGIVMIDTPDPLCEAAALFEMEAFMIIAYTETKLFQRLLQRFASVIQPQTESIAKALPGRLWRIYGPEYASPPFLPPSLFETFVISYDEPMIKAIQQFGGYARIHAHGRLKAILGSIASTGCDGLDPIEPPPQGDVSLRYVRERYGEQLVLFGNLEASDIENLSVDEFRQKVLLAIEEGMSGSGRGFVLMPSACPYGRILSPLAYEKYQTIIEVIEKI